MNDLDDFDDAFFGDSHQQANMESGSGSNVNAGEDELFSASTGGTKEEALVAKKRNGSNEEEKDDDAISIGSSSSSSSGSSSSDSSSNSSDDDSSVECIGFATVGTRKKRNDGPLKKHATTKNNGNAASKGNIHDSVVSNAIKKNASKGNDDVGLDDDLDDDDDDDFEGCDGFLSQSPMPETSVQKNQPSAIQNEKPTVPKKGNNRFDLDSLDDDELAELDEYDFTNGATSTENGHVKNDDIGNFTISYNGEKKECPSQEELVDSSDDDEGNARGKGNTATTNKENSSPNKSSKSNASSYFSNAKSSGQQDDSNVEVLDLFGNDADVPVSPPRKEAPDSPSSLDTPRALSLTPVPARDCGAKKEEVAASANDKTSAGDRKPKNPYRTNPHQNNLYQKQQSVDAKTSSCDNDIDFDIEKQLFPTNDTDNNTTSKADSTREVSSDSGGCVSGVIALPDIGLSPNGQQTELQRLGITHSQYKPSPYTSTTDPIVHNLNERNRTRHTRKQVAVNQVFQPPVSNIWKNKFTKFNHVQSEMVNSLANTDDNVIVSAPTGAGKTALFEMAMARLFASNVRHGGEGVGSKSRKVVYIAPNKALCEERQADWSKRLLEIDRGIVCTTITGDIKSGTSYNEIAMANLILTTPEKWDSITRRWNDQFVLLSTVKLVLLDEVHLIGEPERGGCLESVISRMKTIQRAACAKKLTVPEIASSSYNNTTPEAIASNMRIVAVSATLPNLGELASFVESGEAFVFDQSYRPVPLNIYVQACGHIGKNRYLFDKSLAQHVPNILSRFSNGRPTIVFCHSKRETEELAEMLSGSWATQSRANQPQLMNFSSKTNTAILHRCLRKGIAFHHAGLDASDRRLVEEAFGSGAISCLCATSTLAMGVNLPSHLVVIKGTSAYRGAENGHQDIDAGTLMQMMGRAGRPGFDKSGTAVIMTDTFSKTRYENVSNGQKVVESHLMDDNKLTEVLNIEISQGVITRPEEAVDWVKGTFLFRRIKSHPLFYGFNGKGDDALHTFVLGKVTDSINKLRKIRAIAVDDDGTFSPTAGCHVMSRNFVDFETMKCIVKLPHDCKPVQLLHMLSNCTKLQTTVRRDEKKHLNSAYKTIKYKMDGPQSKIRIQQPEEKAFVMIQAAIGRHYFEDNSLRQQMSNLIDTASQILTAVEQYAKEGSGHGQVATQGMLFRRSLYSSLWGENDGVLNQINGVSQEMVARLKEHGISSFADAMTSSDDILANACNAPTSFAGSLRASAAKILHRTLKLSACTRQTDDRGLELLVKLDRRVAGASGQSGDDRVVSYSLLIFTDRAGGLLHHSEEITKVCQMRVRCPDTFGRAYIRLVSNLVGLDEQVAIDGNDRVQNSAFALSPHIVTSSKASSSKGRKQSKLTLTTKKAPATSHKRSVDNHRGSVSNVSDLRLHKKGKFQMDQEEDDDDDCIIVDPDATEYAGSIPSKATAPKTGKKKLVTPSPHPRTKKQNTDSLTPARNNASSATQRKERASRSQSTYSSNRPHNSSWSKNSTNNSRKGPRNARASSWFNDKRQQKNSQQTAFNSPKENPFSTYTFDPNNIENSLMSTSDKSKIIPENVTTAAYSTRKPRHGQAFKTPGNRRKSTAASNRISSVGLLQQKAQELQQHHTQTVMGSRNNHTDRDAMQHRMAETASIHGNMGNHANGGGMAGHFHGDGFNQLNPPGMMSQGTNYLQQQQQRLGTSAGSVMQQSFGMASGPSLSPPPPFMGRNNGMMARNNMAGGGFNRGPMAGMMNRPTSAAGQSLASRLRTNFGGGSSSNQQQYGASMLQQQHFSNQGMYSNQQSQNDFQSQHEFHPQMQGGAPIRFQHSVMSQQHDQCNDNFNDPICNGMDPAYGQVDYSGMSQFGDPSFGNMGDHSFGNMGVDIGMDANEFHDPSYGHNVYGNMYSQPETMYSQPEPQPQIGGGGGQRPARNPYNPYKTNAQHRPHNPYFHQQPRQAQHPSQQQEQQQETGPPQEVFVQNNSVKSGLGAGADDASQFDDAFM